MVSNLNYIQTPVGDTSLAEGCKLDMQFGLHNLM